MITVRPLTASSRQPLEILRDLSVHHDLVHHVRGPVAARRLVLRVLRA